MVVPYLQPVQKKLAPMFRWQAGPKLTPTALHMHCLQQTPQAPHEATSRLASTVRTPGANHAPHPSSAGLCT